MSSSLLAQACAALVRQLEEMPRFLERSLAGLPIDVMRARPGCDDLALLEHLWHVHDCDDDLYALRIRRVLAEDRPRLEPVDVAPWPRARGYLSRDAGPALAAFAHGRAGLVETLRGLDEAAFARVGVRSDGSESNVLDIVDQLARHDWNHKWRIASILRECAVAGHALA